jgi:ribA/ribD-fused uncharacterized protein
MIKEFSGDFGWLSNFAYCQVELDGVIYPTTENAYQAAKTTDHLQRVPFELYKPGKAKREGDKLSTYLVFDWRSSRIGIMTDLNKQKYSKEPFRSLLIDTGDVEIQEGNTWRDDFWGVYKGKGSNNLGKIIMSIRNEIKIESW